jgi:hypothetical protein
MSLLQRLKDDLKGGWVAMRRGTARAAVRALEETELLQLRLDVRKLDERVKQLCGDIGERAIELHERGEPGDRILTDLALSRNVEQVQLLRAERAKLAAEMDELQDSR